MGGSKSGFLRSGGRSREEERRTGDGISQSHAEKRGGEMADGEWGMEEEAVDRSI